MELLPYGLGALALFCLVIVAKPDLFRNWTIRSSGRDRSGYDRGVRLGNLPTGLVRVIYLGVAILLAVFAFQVHSWTAADNVCDQVEQVYDAAGDGTRSGCGAGRRGRAGARGRGQEPHLRIDHDHLGHGAQGRQGGRHLAYRSRLVRRQLRVSPSPTVRPSSTAIAR